MTAIASKLIKRDATLSSILLICLLGFLWAITEIIAQYTAAKYNYSLYEVIWVRYVTHLLFLIVVFGPRYGRKIITTQRPGLQLFRATMMLIMPAAFIIGANYMSAGDILSIFWFMPFMVIGLSVFLLKEGAAWQVGVLTLIGLVCTLFLSHPHQPFSTAGIILSLAMGVSFSLYVVMTRILREESTVTNLFYTALGVLITLSFFLPRFWTPLSLTAGILMALVGLLGFALLWVLDKALELTPAATLAPFFYSEIFFLVVIRVITRIL